MIIISGVQQCSAAADPAEWQCGGGHHCKSLHPVVQWCPAQEGLSRAHLLQVHTGCLNSSATEVNAYISALLTAIGPFSNIFQGNFTTSHNPWKPWRKQNKTCIFIQTLTIVFLINVNFLIFSATLCDHSCLWQLREQFLSMQRSSLIQVNSGLWRSCWVHMV